MNGLTVVWWKPDNSMDADFMPEHNATHFIQALNNSGITNERIFVYRQSDNIRHQFEPKSNPEGEMK